MIDPKARERAREPTRPNGDAFNPGGLAANPVAVPEPPPPEHYYTHLPKHPGCAACINCEKRKARKDKARARKRRREEVYTFPIPVPVKDAEQASAAPRQFGESVTSDNIIVIKNAKSAKIEATSLTVKDRGTGWIGGYPARGRTTAEILEAVMDFKGPEKVHYWYSDGALELHAACRAEGIRHDKADSDRHESNGVIERCNRIVIEGTNCFLYQSGMPYK